MATVGSSNFYSQEDQAAILNALFDTNPELLEMLGQDSFAGGVGLIDPRSMENTAQATEEYALTRLCGTDDNFLMYNPLSTKWKFAHIKQNLVYMPVNYIFGMIGYTFSFVIRIAIFVYATFKLIATFFEKIFKGECATFAVDMKIQALFFLGATGELVSSAIGMVCPPVAYKFDEWIHSNRIIHDVYASTTAGLLPLSFWRYELEGREAQGAAIGFGSAPDGASNEHRMRLKKERIKGDLKYYKKGHDNLSTYIHHEEMNGKDGAVLERVSTMGMVNAMKDGRPLSTFKEEAVDKVPEAEKELKRANLERHEKQFLKYWDTLSDSSASRARSFFSRLPFLGSSAKTAQFDYEGPRYNGDTLHNLILFEMIMERDSLTTNDATYFIEGVKTRDAMQRALMRVYFKKGILNLYSENAEIKKHIDAFFGIVEVEKAQLEELIKWKEIAKMPQSQDRSLMVKKMQANQKIATILGQMRASFAEAQRCAIEFLNKEALFEMVILEGKTMSLKEVVKAMVLELKSFNAEWFTTDREMSTVVLKGAYGLDGDNETQK